MEQKENNNKNCRAPENEPEYINLLQEGFQPQRKQGPFHHQQGSPFTYILSYNSWSPECGKIKGEGVGTGECATKGPTSGLAIQNCPWGQKSTRGMKDDFANVHFKASKSGGPVTDQFQAAMSAI